jgi:hypothetical protein
MAFLATVTGHTVEGGAPGMGALFTPLDATGVAMFVARKSVRSKDKGNTSPHPARVRGMISAAPSSVGIQVAAASGTVATIAAVSCGSGTTSPQSAQQTACSRHAPGSTPASFALSMRIPVYPIRLSGRIRSLGSDHDAANQVITMGEMRIRSRT